MITRKEDAIALFKQRFNCAQAIFTAYRPDNILDEENALKLATIFGAGTACTGAHLCGAVSGALMAISMQFGRGNIEDLGAKPKTYELGKQFMAEFEAQNGSCICENLIGMNISTPENMEKADELNLFQTVCLDLVKSSADILDRLL